MTEGRLEATTDRIMQFDTRANMIKDGRIITIRKMEEICSFFGIWLRSYVSIKQLDQCFHRYAKCDAPFLYGESKKKAMKVTNVYATFIYLLVELLERFLMLYADDNLWTGSVTCCGYWR